MRHKVLDVLKTFSKEDTVEFCKYLNSPFFNESIKLKKLFEILIKFYPDFDSHTLTDEMVSKRLNPKLPFNKSTIKVLFSDLYNCSLNFLMVRNVMSRKTESQNFLREELFNRNLLKFVSENIREAESNEPKNLNVEYYLNKFKLFTDKSNLFYITTPRKSSKVLNEDVRLLSQRGEYLTYFFVTEILREYDNVRMLNKSYNISESANFIIKVFEKFDFNALMNFLIHSTDDKTHSAILKIYLLLYLTFKNSDEERFYFEYKKLVLVNLGILSEDEKRFHVSRLTAYCISKLSKDVYLKFHNELFFIYKLLLQKGYYKSSVFKFMADELYRAILLLGLKLNKHNWVKNFIGKYKKRLSPEKRKNMFNFSLAQYYFSRKMFDKAISYSHKINIDDFIFKIDLKNMLLMSYYELGEYEAGLCIVKSYKQFLSADKILSAAQNKRYSDFVNSVGNLFLYKTTSGKKSLFEIELSLKNDFPNNEWVREKLFELPEKHKKVV